MPEQYKIKFFNRSSLYISLGIALVLTTFFGVRMKVMNDPMFGWQIGVASFAFTFIVSYLITSVDDILIKWFQEKYPWQKDNFKRIFIELGLTSLTAAVVMIMVFTAFHAMFDKMDTNEPLIARIMDSAAIAVMVNLVMIGIEETRFLVKQWKQSIVQQETLKRQHAEAQYHALNQQVNPHFLFNSLNTLAAIIPQSTEKSLEFINQFSEVYRYVLDAGAKSLVDVKEEIDFIHSFIYLNKVRFESSLHIEISINPNDLNMLIPPLSLQILVENALKHNEISKAKPLTIEIYSDGQFIEVKNNHNLRNDFRKRSGCGLENLKQRYSLLTEKSVEASVVDAAFVARIPLIEDNDA